jgi:hypothetical protein
VNPPTLQSDEEKSVYACLAQENGFSPDCFLSFAEAGKRHRESCAPVREECNKYDLTTGPWF